MEENEPISVTQQVRRIGAAYASMYAEPEATEEETETKSEEDKDVTTT
jgi:hypothetical protein|tara:strand:- start:1319 stop:1462 length:144 start_codon:yes stop_codon:yes gene_type:complete